MQRAYGDRVQPLDPAKGIGYRVRGAQDSLYFRMFPAAQVYFAFQEFGTHNPIRVLAALRAENRRHHCVPSVAEADARFLEVFCPSSRAWREGVLRRGKEVIAQGLALAFDY